MSKDFADFLDALNKERVRYVVIGGMAVLSYIPYRTTRDIDVLIEASLENGAAARRAIERWGGFEPEFSAEEFVSGDILSFGGLLRVEVHAQVPGVSWEQGLGPQGRRRVGGCFDPLRLPRRPDRNEGNDRPRGKRPARPQAIEDDEGS